jgi:hypothetical protein
VVYDRGLSVVMPTPPVLQRLLTEMRAAAQAEYTNHAYGVSDALFLWADKFEKAIDKQRRKKVTK